MIETVSSTLNPSADVFVPGKISNLKDATKYEGGKKDSSSSLWKISNGKDDGKFNRQLKEIAKQMLSDYLAEKRIRGEETITRQEIVKIIDRIFTRSNCKVNLQKMPIEARLSTLPDVGKLKDVEMVNCCADKSFSFDLSVFKPPKPSMFLSTLYGLYRPEQAVRPILSLTLPPSNLEESLWSITSKDLCLWNPCCDEPCSCPPIFGYSVPVNFFGNPFNLNSKCSKEGIHFSRYAPSPNGNESILFYTKPNSPVDVEPFEDFIEDEPKKESNLEFYSSQMKTIVSGVCDLISVETTQESTTSLSDTFEINDYYQNMFWDADPSKFVRIEEVLEDDNCHPLLEMDYTEESEGVTPEIEEMIRRCLEQDHRTDNANGCGDDERFATGCCDPPCSIWCHSSPKYQRSDSSSSSVSANISLLNDTTDFLLNASEGNISLDGDSDLEPHSRNRIFKRSFSANDCDLPFEERYKINREVSQFSASSREDLEFLRRDPINYFKSFQKGDSWKDNDSGIVSNWSSHEDINLEDGSGFDPPMWSLFNAEDSLWKPLPECAQQEQHSKFMPKRVRDLRRQKSLS